MPRTVDHIVETHRLARQRVAAGLPSWAHRIDVSDVFHNESMTFEEIRDAVVARLRASLWLAGRDEFDPVVEVVDNLADAEDTAEFDGWWDDLYDAADMYRVWIRTR